MRRTGHARRRVRAASSPGLSMFPFLAVLICTIGSLVVLLVVITRQARIQAAIAAASAAADAARDAEDQREMAEWRIEQLRKSREKTLEQVADLRNALGHLEDHSRTIEAELRELKRTWEALGQGSESAQKASLEADLARTIMEIEAAEKALADAERRVADRPPSFAVIPYQGPNETRRRPMYIECQGDQIILQPEGIALRPDDFDGPDGPGNPLAASLRAKREYLLTYGSLDPQQAGEPYPLLIVRPDGIAAYYAARHAMTSWGSEFGYELVESGWKIEFPQPDPRLAELLRRTVEASRVRQEQLAAAAPRHYGSQRSQVMYRAAPGGGITVDGASRRPIRPSPKYGRPGVTSSSPTGPASDGSRAHGSLAPGDQSIAPQRESGSSASSDVAGAHRAPWPDSTRPGTMAESRFAHAGSGAGQRPAAPAGQRPGDAPQADSPGLATAGSRRDAAVSSSEGTPPELGEWRDPETLRPLADKKGTDWALPNANRRATPITRAVRIECHADRLLLPSPSGQAGGRTIRLGPNTAESMDELAAAVWDVIDGWGIAGRDMYWSPLLEARVAPGAETRFSELEVLLHGSGLTLERL